MLGAASEGEDEEDAEYQAAIAASLADAQHMADQWTSAGQRSTDSRRQQEQRQQAASGDAGGELALLGLRNEVGEYNCFLNVIIQCLWRCDDFRRQVSRSVCGRVGWAGGCRSLGSRRIGRRCTASLCG